MPELGLSSHLNHHGQHLTFGEHDAGHGQHVLLLTHGQHGGLLLLTHGQHGGLLLLTHGQHGGLPLLTHGQHGGLPLLTNGDEEEDHGGEEAMDGGHSELTVVEEHAALARLVQGGVLQGHPCRNRLLVVWWWC